MTQTWWIKDILNYIEIFSFIFTTAAWIRKKKSPERGDCWFLPHLVVGDAGGGLQEDWN